MNNHHSRAETSSAIISCSIQPENGQFAAKLLHLFISAETAPTFPEFAFVVPTLLAPIWRTLRRSAARGLVLPVRRPAQLERQFLHGPLADHWGDFGGTPHGKDGEIRVRMGKFIKQPWLGRGWTTGVFSRRYVENKGLSLAPQVGFEPTTLRLTA